MVKCSECGFLAKTHSAHSAFESLPADERGGEILFERLQPLRGLHCFAGAADLDQECHTEPSTLVVTKDRQCDSFSDWGPWPWAN